MGRTGDYDPAELPPDILAAVNAGIADGHKAIVDGAAAAVEFSKLYGTREFMGTRYLDRAVGVEAGGIIPNVPKQAFYGQWTADASGAPLDGSKASYTFTFPKGAASTGPVLLEPDHVRPADPPPGGQPH